MLMAFCALTADMDLLDYVRSRFQSNEIQNFSDDGNIFIMLDLLKC
jgi:hypothetical protein